MLKAIVLSVALALAANACVVDINNGWTYHYTNDVLDAATTGLPLNNNYNCFDACAETGVVMESFKVEFGGNGPRDSFSQFVQHDSKLDFDSNLYTCVDPNLRAAIQRTLDKLTSYTAKSIATALQYNLNLPGWVINVVKTKELGGGLNNYYADKNYCEYQTEVQGINTNIKMGLVDTQA